MMQNMPYKRSPRAPSLALEQALERVLRVYEQERLHSAPVDAVAKALGFKSANSGSSNATIASLLYFGLLFRPKDGFLAVSRDVEIYKYARDEKLKKQMVLDFLRTPPLYLDLLEKHSGGLPSSAKLKSELIQRAFLPQAVDAVLSAFLQSVGFARYFEVQPRSMGEELPSARLPKAEEPEPEPEPDIEGVELQLLQSKPEAASKISANSSVDMDQIPIRLSGGRKAWLNIPTPFYESDKARIKAQIDVLFADTDTNP
jgi:hypothetical protein